MATPSCNSSDSFSQPFPNASSSVPSGANYTAPTTSSPRLDPEFHAIRHAYRVFGTTVMLVSMGSFLLYVLLSCFAPDVMNLQVAGHVTLGLLGGLAQLVIMGVSAWFYAVRMRARVDPIVDRFREKDRQRAEARQQRQRRQQQHGEGGGMGRARAW
jgi:uncharacterized membrane protein (DUF485 family)